MGDYQNLFMAEQDEGAKLTIAMLKKWVIDTFPPPPMRHEWIFKLKSIRVRKNEDPKLVYSKYKAVLKLVETAITELNVDVEQVNKIKSISDETKCEILWQIFVKNNNSAKLGNDGKINEKTVEYIVDEDPSKVDDWEAIFTTIRDKTVKRLYRTLNEWQYQTYPVDPAEYNIYLTNTKPSSPKPKIPLNPVQIQIDIGGKRQKRKNKKRRRDKDAQLPPWRRQKVDSCKRCGRKGHNAANYWSKVHIDGHSLYKDNTSTPNPPPRTPQKHCTRCGRNNHYIRDCTAFYYPDGTKITDSDPPKRKGKGKGKGRGQNNQRRNKGGNQPELAVIDRGNVRNNNSNISENELLTLLTQKINNTDSNLTPEQQMNATQLINEIKNTVDPRQDF